MKELTIESLKKIGKRYRLDTKLFGSFISGYGSLMTHERQFSVFINSIISFVTEEELKNFLKNELLKITIEDIKEIFDWKRTYLKDLTIGISRLLRDEMLELNEIEIQFLFLLMWRFYELEDSIKYPNHRKKDPVEYLKSDKSLYRDTKKNIAMALINIDYLDYFDSNENKKELFELSISI